MPGMRDHNSQCPRCERRSFPGSERCLSSQPKGQCRQLLGALRGRHGLVGMEPDNAGGYFSGWRCTKGRWPTDLSYSGSKKALRCHASSYSSSFPNCSGCPSPSDGVQTLVEARSGHFPHAHRATLRVGLMSPEASLRCYFQTTKGTGLASR